MADDRWPMADADADAVYPRRRRRPPPLTFDGNVIIDPTVELDVDTRAKARTPRRGSRTKRRLDVERIRAPPRRMCPLEGISFSTKIDKMIGKTMVWRDALVACE